MGFVVVGCEYNRNVLGKVNPRTNEPCRPHVRIHIYTDEELADEAEALLNSINASRGWFGETYVKPMFEEAPS